VIDLSHRNEGDIEMKVDKQNKKSKAIATLSKEGIDLINEAKALSKQVGQFIEKLQETESLDQRWIATCKTDLKKGFMSAIRGIAKPTTF